mgnify:CR=1 FL=1
MGFKHYRRKLLYVLAVAVVTNGMCLCFYSAAAAEAYVLPIKGPIDKTMLYVFRRAFKQVESAEPDALVLELDTPGGGLRETKEIINWMRSLDVPIYAFVNRDALSAGAIICLGADEIYMAPGSTIGSAMPVMLTPGGGVQQMPPGIKEKMLSAVRGRVRGLAQEKGHSEAVAEAMVDPSKELKIGEHTVSRKGELLNLTAEEAIQILPPQTTPLLATAIVDDIDALLTHARLPGEITTQRFQEEAADRLARYITMIGPILLAVGILGLYIEIKTPGFGIPGIAGIICLMIYFFGHYVAGLAGLEDIALVLAGIVFLGVEVFVLPGFGVAGVLGILCITGGVILGLIPYLPDAGPPLPNVPADALSAYLETALWKFLITLGLAFAGVWALSRILPKTPIYRSFVLQAQLSPDQGYTSSDTEKSHALLGTRGVTSTPLRPAGIAMFGDQRIDVVSSGDLIPAGVNVRVTEVQGSRIVVEKVDVK